MERGESEARRGGAISQAAERASTAARGIRRQRRREQHHLVLAPSVHGGACANARDEQCAIGRLSHSPSTEYWWRVNGRCQSIELVERWWRGRRRRDCQSSRFAAASPAHDDHSQRVSSAYSAHLAVRHAQPHSFHRTARSSALRSYTVAHPRCVRGTLHRAASHASRSQPAAALSANVRPTGQLPHARSFRAALSRQPGAARVVAASRLLTCIILA